MRSNMSLCCCSEHVDAGFVRRGKDARRGSGARPRQNGQRVVELEPREEARTRPCSRLVCLRSSSLLSPQNRRNYVPSTPPTWRATLFWLVGKTSPSSSHAKKPGRGDEQHRVSKYEIRVLILRHPGK